jgi:hypothetical protein
VGLYFSIAPSNVTGNNEVARSLLAKHQRPALLRAFFQHVRLDW